MAVSTFARRSASSEEQDSPLRHPIRDILRHLSRDHTWHLPDGRTLRVVTTSNVDCGGVYLSHDVTERLDLMRRPDTLIWAQGETHD